MTEIQTLMSQHGITEWTSLSVTRKGNHCVSYYHAECRDNFCYPGGWANIISIDAIFNPKTGEVYEWDDQSESWEY